MPILIMCHISRMKKHHRFVFEPLTNKQVCESLLIFAFHARRCLRANIIDLHSRVQEYLDGAAHQKFLAGAASDGGLASPGDAVTYLLALEALQVSLC